MLMGAKLKAPPSPSGHLNVKKMLRFHIRCFEILQRVRDGVRLIDEVQSIGRYTLRPLYSKGRSDFDHVERHLESATMRFHRGEIDAPSLVGTDALHQ